MTAPAERHGKGRTVAFETLGCKLNQYETDAIATAVANHGYRVVPLQEDADAYVINSCTVTNKADRKTRNTINRALRLGADRAPVVVTGCFVNSHPEVDDRVRYWIDNNHKNTIPEVLDAHFRGETVDPHTLAADPFGYTPPKQIFHTRTNLKVQEGCDNFCTFCIIPFVRGRARSRAAAAVLQEARAAVLRGSRELVLTGVNMSRYRHEEADFTALVARILELPGTFRVRISSLEPDQLDQRFLDLFRHEKMCRHLHLCLQSGSDRILLQMRRMYTLQSYREVVQRLRALDPLFNVTTDLITGFPGESEADFERSLNAVREFTFGHVHVFPYSVRSGTRAERMTGAVPVEERRRRTTLLQEVADREKQRYRRQLVGSTAQVLVEKLEETPGGVVAATGLSGYYVPVRFTPGARTQHNTVVETKIDGMDDHAGGFTLLGTEQPR